MQILTALDQHTGCVLSETAIASDTNEAKTAVKFLKTLVLDGKTVVGDAAFCQRDICETILSGHGEYLILVKDNQPTLHKEAIQAFVIPEGFSPYAKRKAREARRTATTIEKSHGGIERRTLTTTTVGTDTCDWPGLRQFLKLERETTVKGETKTTVAYAITSRSVASSTAEQVLALWRDRWGIENRLFWVKDVTLREDQGRIRSGRAAFVMSIIRNATINYIRSSGNECIAAALRSNVLRIPALLTRLGILIQ